MSAEFTFNGRTLTVHADQIEVTSMMPDYRPDPNWRHTDSNGHEHAWVDGALPTLVFKFEDWIDADGDSRSDSWHECGVCGEGVRPGYEEVPGTGGGIRRFVQGAVRYEIDGVPVSEDEARQFLAGQEGP